MKKDKINSIEDIDSLIGLVDQLINKLGITDVERKSKYVLKGIEASPLKERKTYFILTISELNGKVSLIQNEVETIKKDADQIYIITSHHKLSNYFQNWIYKETEFANLEFWSSNNLIKLIDVYLPDFWGHGDAFIQAYENGFIEKIEKDKELKKLLKLDDKYDKHLNIFIEPKIYVFTEDKETKRRVKKKISTDSLLKRENHILSGEAGTGKSTLLKEIGKKIIEKNKNSPKKTIPILITSGALAQNNFDIKRVIKLELVHSFSKFGVEKVLDDYYIILLIDSIDEFEENIRIKLLETLDEIGKKQNFNYILCTRNYESLIAKVQLCDHQNPFLVNFDLKQVKKYLDDFFRFDLSKSDKLWCILTENNTLEKIPITPLAISLISILYEDKGYEVPATITDVYDNFSLFLLGRLSMSSRLDFLNINIKKRLISSYALDIIKSENRLKKKEEDFIKYIIDFFERKSITIDEELVPELLKSLTDGTGVLFIDENKNVAFKHDHFMEYYASVEIFDHHRETHEKELIERFRDFNWQNTAVFYVGRTKDMPYFVKKLIDQVKTYKYLNDCLLGVSGIGYVLQSAWMTDAKIRKDGIKAALDLLIRANLKVKELAASKFPYFQKVTIPDVALMNLIWFYKHYNSIALKDSLILAFDDLYNDFEEVHNGQFRSDSSTMLYKLFCIAATLDTGRNALPEKLETLFDVPQILTNPLFVLLFDAGLKVLETENENVLKKRFKINRRVEKYIKGIKFYLETPSEDLIFTSFDSITPVKHIEIFTEGKSDAVILNHAYSALTNGREPNWKVLSCETSLKSKSGGANALAKLLVKFSNSIETEYDLKKTIIGVFDNDSKGCQEFNGLDSDFVEQDSRIKKHKKLNIFAIKLPIPPEEEYNSYHQDKQSFRFFEIEHYFPLVYLKEKNMVKETSIPNVFEIKDKKSDFSNVIKEETDANLFRNFRILFDEINKILGQEENYIE